MIGIRMSATSDWTMVPNAAPMMTPTARSTTFPRNAKFLNSSSIAPSRPAPTRTLVDQPGMHHGGADRRPGGGADRHHRQPYGVVAFAENRQRVFCRCRIGLEKQGGVQRHQLVLIRERTGVIA